ncbi:MAG TPA: pantoate--beta-alanine ligase [Longimicrobiales bacterium]
MNVVTTRAAVREAVARLRTGAEPSRGARIALVPTMGSLHEGHLSLVDRARERADHVVLSIFVNPLQFGPGEDFERYPRDAERDLRLAEARGVDVVFLPEAGEMYPAGAPAVQIVPMRLADRLCGAFRPGHFQGVLTVVAKLFHVVQPDVAVFGQKDYQQALLVQRMVQDLDFPIEIEVAPIVRESDGLAMSSRNVYLEPEARASASSLWRGLRSAAEAFGAGERDAARLRRLVLESLGAEPGIRPQYVELVHPTTLEPLEEAEPGAVLAAAVFVGETRLIDNVILQ